MRVLSLFDGIAGGRIALERAGIPVESYYASEIDLYAMSIARKNWRDIQFIGDVTQIDWTQYIDKVDMIIGGSPCFTAETLVMTDKGMKPISEIEEGDMVLTHKSRYRKVLKTGWKMVDNIYKVTGYGFDEINTTEEHPFYTRRLTAGCKWDTEIGQHRYDFDLAEPTWVKTKDLKGNDRLGSTYSKEYDKDSRFTLAQWEFIGMLMSNVLFTSREIVWRSDLDIYKHFKLFNQLGFTYRIDENPTRTMATHAMFVGNVNFRTALKPYLSADIIPEELWKSPLDCKEAFLKGFMEYHGCEDNEHVYSYKTTNLRLIYELKQLFLEVHDISCKIYKVTDTLYRLDAPLLMPTTKGMVEGDYIWQPFDKYEIKYQLTPVYNLEVEEDNSYTANTIVVHNCTQLSICGDRTGLEGDASKLFFNMVDAINTIKPKYFFLENVASMTDENRDVMTSYMGVEPIMINSALLSSQQRKRYYWFNWDAEQPEDKHISVEDILDLSYTKATKRTDVTWTKDDLAEKSDKLEQIGYFGNGGQGLRIYSTRGKGNTLGTGGSNNEKYLVHTPNGDIIRELSTLELERQQTLPDNYTKMIGVPNGERRKGIGNGWTIDVIAHLFKAIPKED